MQRVEWLVGWGRQRAIVCCLLAAPMGVSSAPVSASPARISVPPQPDRSVVRVQDTPANYVWQLAEEPGEWARLAVVDANDESGESLSLFSMRCLRDRPWTIRIEDVDAAAVGNAFVSGNPVEVRIAGPDQSETNGAGAVTPDILFGGEMYGNWDFSLRLTLDMVDDLARLPSMTVVGTGVQRALPTQDMQKSLARFRELCSAFGDGYQQME